MLAKLARLLTRASELRADAISCETMSSRARMLSVSLSVVAAASCLSSVSRSALASRRRSRAETTARVMSCDERDRSRTLASLDRRWTAVSSRLDGTRSCRSPPLLLEMLERRTNPPTSAVTSPMLARDLVDLRAAARRASSGRARSTLRRCARSDRRRRRRRSLRSASSPRGRVGSRGLGAERRHRRASLGVAAARAAARRRRRRRRRRRCRSSRRPAPAGPRRPRPRRRRRARVRPCAAGPLPPLLRAGWKAGPDPPVELVLPGGGRLGAVVAQQQREVRQLGVLGGDVAAGQGRFDRLELEGLRTGHRGSPEAWSVRDEVVCRRSRG